MKDLVGNFSQMTILYSTNSAGGGQNSAGNSTVSFAVVGHPTVSGTSTTEVNFTLSTSSSGGGGSTNQTALAYLDGSGSVVLLTMQGQNFTSQEAQAVGSALTAPFTAYLSYSDFPVTYQSAFVNFHSSGPTTQTYGHLTMPVTTYTATSAALGGFNGQVTLQIGQPPGKHFQMLAGLTESGTQAGTTFDLTMKLISATLA
jgi:hypothetical protein